MRFAPKKFVEADAESPALLTRRLNDILDELEEIFARVSVTDNLQAQYHEQQLVGGNAPYFITPTFEGSVKAVLVVQVLSSTGAPLASWPTDGVELSWIYDGNVVKIDNISGIASGTKYFFRFLLLGE